MQKSFSPIGFKALLAATVCSVIAIIPQSDAFAQTIRNDDPALFRNTEFKLSYHLGAVKSEFSYGRGFAGAGQRVAVFDSGINATNYDLSGQFVTAGYDVYTGGGALTDTNGHGTFVGGIIAAKKNNYGSHGIAFDSKLIAVRIVRPDGSINANDAQLTNGINFAFSNGARVFNNSWNSSANIYEVSRAQIDYYMPRTIAAWRNAVNNNTVVVFAAGNEGKAQPGFYAALPVHYGELERGWVSVVATGENGALSSYSNRCGSTANWCIAAPGTNVVSTYKAGLARGSGTSFAAPVVSAAFAIMRQRWPHLSNQQIRDIVFRTANKTGIYANRAVYGQGFLDLNKATAPVGGTSVATSTRTSGPSTSTSSTTVSFGRGLRGVSAGDLPSMIVLDEYGRDYELDTTALFQKASDAFDTTSALKSFGNGMDSFRDGAATYAYSFTADSKTSLTNAPLDGLRLFIDAPISAKSSVTSSFNIDPSASFGLAPRDEMFAGNAVDNEALSNPFMAFAKNPVTMTAKTMLANDVWVKGGTFMGQQAIDPSAPVTLSEDPNFIRKRGSVFGAAAEMGVKLGKKSGLAFTAGFAQEEGAFLGSTSSGAASLADKTTTSFIAASAKLDMGSGVQAFGGFEFGLSDVDAASNSIVKGISGVTSQSFRVGLIKNGVMNKADKLGFVLSQPLRVNSGNANLDVPVARDTDGNITTRAASLALGAESNQLDMQAFYATEVSKDSSFSAGLLFRQNVGHEDGNSEAVALARYKLSF